jgi:hypothetical protein
LYDFWMANPIPKDRRFWVRGEKFKLQDDYDLEVKILNYKGNKRGTLPA